MSASYTARRLEHATPEHLDLTTRRTFLGPVPAGWLRSHRKQWYKEYFSLGTRRPSFRADTSGFDGVSELPLRDDSAASTDRHASALSTQNNSAAPGTDGAAESRFDPSSQDDNTLSSPPQPLDPRPDTDLRLSGVDSESRQATVVSTSTTSLLHSQHVASARHSQEVSTYNDPSAASNRLASHTTTTRLVTPSQAISHLRVRFSDASRLQLRARAKRLGSKTGLRSSNIKDGALLKVDKMLVRVDITQQHLSDYDERISQGVETKTLDKWREYVVVCRKHVDGDVEAVLQLHQTRVIAATEDRKVKKRTKDEIPLSQNRTRVGLFSTLDKTLCVWTIKNTRTTIYYLKPESAATSVEWYTFLRSVMGLGRPDVLNINVPDLRISLRLTDPFRSSEVEEHANAAATGDDNAIVKALSHEANAARAIVARCVDLLKTSPEWEDVLKLWSEQGNVGLAWKRYDRLEWISSGAAEQKMFGTMAMSQTHDLELRSMNHYPTKLDSDPNSMTEPRAVEGFLIRLTTHTGASRRLGKLAFNRLYFTTQNQYLVFLRPSRANPPPPPKLIESTSIPSSKQLAKESPLMYDVDPYSQDRLHPDWATRKDASNCDNYAQTEADRQMAMLLSSEGFINLCDIKQVRVMHASTIQDTGAEPGGDDVDFDVDEPADGLTDELDEDRVFELVMKNGLVISLQAFSKAMRTQWIQRLRNLTRYWTQRIAQDMTLYKAVRHENLQTLKIDERAEAVVGQYAYKWEVSQSFASSSLYNVCGLSSCRAIHHAGVLYRKPRRRTTFSRCHVILASGHLLIYQDAIRKRNGRLTAAVDHQRLASIDLQGCYLYSGLLTEDDLLYQNQTFDSNGHPTLPRVYLEDGWTSTDEDAMTTFVLWHGTSKSWFRSSKTVDDVKNSQKNQSKTQTKLKRVGKLGAQGRSVCFKARSRAERDHWVLAIQSEIEKGRTDVEGDIRLEEGSA